MHRPFLVGLVRALALAEAGVAVRIAFDRAPCGIGDFVLCDALLPLRVATGGNFLSALFLVKALFAAILFTFLSVILRARADGSTLATSITWITVLAMSLGEVTLK